MILGHDKDFIYFKGSHTQAATLGGEYVKSKDAYKVPIHLEVVQELEKYYDIEKIRDLKTKLIKYREWVSRIDKEHKDDRLRDYQKQDANFLEARSHAAVFNEQRTGKTPTILVATKDKLKKGVIICPAGLKLNWQREIKVWTEKESIVIKGTP